MRDQEWLLLRLELFDSFNGDKELYTTMFDKLISKTIDS